MTETGEKLPPENGGDMGHIGGRKGQGRPLIHGQYKKPKPLKDLDRRTEEYQFRSGVIKGIESDFGRPLSFGEFTIAEILSGSLWIVQQGMKMLSSKGKIESLFFNTGLNTIYNVTTHHIVLGFVPCMVRTA